MWQIYYILVDNDKGSAGSSCSTVRTVEINGSNPVIGNFYQPSSEFKK